jgi:hypothetical protein
MGRVRPFFEARRHSRYRHSAGRVQNTIHTRNSSLASLPSSLRQFIIAAARHGCQEKTIVGEIVGARGPVRGRYLVRRVGGTRLAVVLPNIRDSDRLSETVFESLVRNLQLESVRDDLL